ncbi:hypothetical protein DFP72DRAFT_1077430 [Ephemerocybe angulata]|uniref:Uncharacterized protein n=1 Tax=Ephemerocybe angulata TaxID=980116 RepID=A0A8H6HEA5_9AGAR|nr:hypothetical protein DFP72DRAFT_1077430 [Tulosesus angulatus]
MLKHCTNLETLTFDFNYKCPLLFEDSRPRLQTLYHTSIVFPRLRTLRIRHTPDIDLLLGYLQASALLHLVLQSLRIPSDELRLCLSDLPSLKRLTLEQITLEDDGPLFVDAYYGEEGNTMTGVSPDLPALEQLELFGLPYVFILGTMRHKCSEDVLYWLFDPQKLSSRMIPPFDSEDPAL